MAASAIKAFDATLPTLLNKPVLPAVADLANLGSNASLASPNPFQLSTDPVNLASRTPEVASVINDLAVRRSATVPIQPLTQIERVTQSLNRQLHMTSPEEIRSIIQSFPQQDRDLALGLLQQMGQFGNMDSFNGLMAEIHNLQGLPVYTPGKASLADNLKYIFQKKSQFYVDPASGRHVQLPNGYYDSALSFTSKLEDAKAIVLDRNMLELLRTKPEMLDLVRTNNMQVLYPQGWINGLNPFNHGSTVEMQRQLATLLGRAKSLTQAGSEPSAAIERVLNGKITDEMHGFGIGSQLSILKNPAVSGTAVPENVAAQLSHQPVTQERLVSNLTDKLGFTREQDMRLAQQVIQEQALVYSPQRLAEISRQQHRNAMQMASDKGIPAEHVYYIVPYSGKSYGMVTMIHQMANNIPSKQIITNVSEIPSPVKKPLVVLLDDVAGSGDSLVDAYHSIRGDGYSYSSSSEPFSGDILISPYVAYDKSKAAFSQLLQNDAQLAYQPAQEVTGIYKSRFYQNLDDAGKAAVNKVLGYSGYSGTGGHVAFPYMSPDNNTALAAQSFSPLITLNGQGVK